MQYCHGFPAHSTWPRRTPCMLCQSLYKRCTGISPHRNSTTLVCSAFSPSETTTEADHMVVVSCDV